MFRPIRILQVVVESFTPGPFGRTVTPKLASSLLVQPDPTHIFPQGSLASSNSYVLDLTFPFILFPLFLQVS